MTDKCLPFFKAFRASFSWTEECQAAFKELKLYLTSPPLLKSPQVGETLYLYLAASEDTVAVVLVKLEGVHQFKVYFVIKVFQNGRKLRPYFQAHSVVVVTNQPMKEVLSKVDTSGRVTKWSIELVEYGIDFTLRIAIKVHAPTDFIVEFSFERTVDVAVYINGFTTKTRSGVGALIIDLSGNEW
ncbi:protein SRG1 [Gossypium australe]|uniref:Protein SRG1 n=1 Tax=Gossypium australe TaxID=47621 RepID=A0A5B6WN86_9ROSI|nr:protein SRG1 [Gossypium australe]